MENIAICVISRALVELLTFEAV